MPPSTSADLSSHTTLWLQLHNMLYDFFLVSHQNSAVMDLMTVKMVVMKLIVIAQLLYLTSNVREQILKYNVLIRSMLVMEYLIVLTVWMKR